MILDPLRIAMVHQQHMHKLVEEIRANAGGIRQLLVGRTVRRKSDGIEFHVKEARLGISSIVSLYGRRANFKLRAGRGGRYTRIGTVADIEIVENPS